MKISPISRQLSACIVLACAALLPAVGLIGCSGGADGTSANVASADELWCKEHGVEEKYCVICHPEIRENPDILLCPEHGDIPEAICVACHPELAEKYETCEHSLPPAFCQTCNPEQGGHDHDHDHGHDHGHDHDHDHGSHDHDHESGDSHSHDNEESGATS